MTPTIPYKLIAGLVGSLVAIAALCWLVQSRNHWRDKATTNEQLYHGEQAAHQQTVANYRAAAEQARKADAENVAKHQAQAEAINERTSNEYEARIAAANVQYQRLQQSSRAAAANSGRSGNAALPTVPDTASGTNEAPEQGELSSSDALTATKQAIQLDELINWIEAHTGNPE